MKNGFIISHLCEGNYYPCSTGAKFCQKKSRKQFLKKFSHPGCCWVKKGKENWNIFRHYATFFLFVFNSETLCFNEFFSSLFIAGKLDFHEFIPGKFPSSSSSFSFLAHCMLMINGLITARTTKFLCYSVFTKF